MKWGGAPNSQHLLGKAADVRSAGITPQEMRAHAVTVDCFRLGGIGEYPTFTHVDVRDNGPARWSSTE